MALKGSLKDWTSNLTGVFFLGVFEAGLAKGRGLVMAGSKYSAVQHIHLCGAALSE